MHRIRLDALMGFGSTFFIPHTSFVTFVPAQERSSGLSVRVTELEVGVVRDPGFQQVGQV
jgi:hypothetical protein